MKKTNLNCLNKQFLKMFKLWCEWSIVRFFAGVLIRRNYKGVYACLMKMINR